MLSPHTEEDPDELASGTLLLHGQYQIESYLIRGGFGITYLARDSLDRRVVIKECFPNSVCCRIGGQVLAREQTNQDQFNGLLRHFLREARRLARLSHPNIVGVHQVFEENSTAYMALDHVDGMDLLSVIEDDPDRLTPDMIRSMLIKSLGAISYIHDKEILHRDISPDNFLLDKADKLTLIDFGAARESATKGSRALSTLLAVKDGYSPHEFYIGDTAENPSSDLYALGATFYHLITGKAPPNSQQRLAAIAADTPDPYVPLVAIKADYEPDFLNAINKSLEIFPEDRLQSAQDWVEAIDPERRRQAAMARASKDTTIRQKISQLVAETNLNLRAPAPSLAESRRQASTSRTTDRQGNTKPPKQEKPLSKPVDIFGEPIDDVEAWLSAQDRIAETKPIPKAHPKRVTPFRPVQKHTLNADPVLDSMPKGVPHPEPRFDFQPTPRPKATNSMDPLWIRNPMAAPQSSPSAAKPERPTLMRTLIGRISTTSFFPPKKTAKSNTEKELP